MKTDITKNKNFEPTFLFIYTIFISAAFFVVGCILGHQSGKKSVMSDAVKNNVGRHVIEYDEAGEPQTKFKWISEW